MDICRNPQTEIGRAPRGARLREECLRADFYSRRTGSSLWKRIPKKCTRIGAGSRIFEVDDAEFMCAGEWFAEKVTEKRVAFDDCLIEKADAVVAADEFADKLEAADAGDLPE